MGFDFDLVLGTYCEEQRRCHREQGDNCFKKWNPLENKKQVVEFHLILLIILSLRLSICGNICFQKKS